jgi:hypothetical protein
VSLYWLANGALAADYSVFVHLAGSDGVPLAQHDGQPQDGRYPTSVWQKGDIVADAHELALGAGLPPGEYRLMAGLYDPITGLRLGTPGADSVQLATIILL